MDLEGILEEISQAGFTSDTESLSNQIIKIRQRTLELKTNIITQQDDIDSTMDSLDRFTNSHLKLQQTLKHALDDLRTNPLNTSRVEKIQKEIKDLEEYRETMLEALQMEYSAVIEEGQSLISTAMPGVSTKQLDKAVNELNSLWTELNQELFARHSELDKSLVKFCQVNEALSSMLGWIARIEDLQRSQRPFSVDYRSLKSQIQLQEMLQLTIHDRSDSYSSLMTQLEKTNTKSPGSRDQITIQEQLEVLSQRWMNLNKTAETNKSDLKKIFSLSEKFHERCEIFMTWLNDADKLMTQLETKPRKMVDLTQLLRRLVEMRDDMKTKSSNLEWLKKSGADLKKRGTDADKIQLKFQLDHVTSRYQTVCGRIEDHRLKVKEIPEVIDGFYETHKIVEQRVKGVEEKLRVSSLRGATGDDQHVQELLEELAVCQCALDEEMKSSTNLMAVLSKSSNIVDPKGRVKLKKKVTETISADRAAVESIAERIRSEKERMSNHKSRCLQMLKDVNGLISQCKKVGDRMKRSSHLNSDPEKLQRQLAEQKNLLEDVVGQKCRTADILSAFNLLKSSASSYENTKLESRLEELKRMTDDLSERYNKRLDSLERILALAEDFSRLRSALSASLRDIGETVDDITSAGLFTEQQENIKLLRKSLSENKGILDQLNSAQIYLTACLENNEAKVVRDLYQQSKQLFDSLKNDIEALATSAESQLHQSNQGVSSIDDLTEFLGNLQGKLIDSISDSSTDIDAMKNRLNENETIIQDLDTRTAQLQQIQSAIKTKSGAALTERTKQIFKQISQLKDARSLIVSQNETLQISHDRVIDFQQGYHHITETIKRLESRLEVIEEPIVLDIIALKKQHESAEVLCTDVKDLEKVIKNAEQSLIALEGSLGEGERADFKKLLDDVLSDWHRLNDSCRTRRDAVSKTSKDLSQYNDLLLNVTKRLQTFEEKLNSISSGPEDVDKIRISMSLVKDLESGVKENHSDLEKLKEKFDDLAANNLPEKLSELSESVRDITLKWGQIWEAISERKITLQRALLKHGEVEEALKEMKSWLSKTLKFLEKPCIQFCEPKIIDAEISTVKILQTELASHRWSIEEHLARIRSGSKEMKSGGSNPLQGQMTQLLDESELVKEKMAVRMNELMKLRERSVEFYGQFTTIKDKLSNLELKLSSNRSIAATTEMLKHQQAALKEWMNDLVKAEDSMKDLTGQLISIFPECNRDVAERINQQISGLAIRADALKQSLCERANYLKEASDRLTEFNALLGGLVQWVSGTEQKLSKQQPVSRDMKVLKTQIDEHKTIQKALRSQRELITKLEKLSVDVKATGWRNKQHLAVINDQLSGLKNRFTSVQAQLNARKNQLDSGEKESKIFHDSYKDLMKFLSEANSSLEAGERSAVEASDLQSQLQTHEELQRIISDKQQAFDTLVKLAGTGPMNDEMEGKDHHETPDEMVFKQPTADAIKSLVAEVSTKWSAVCNKSADRQTALEGAMMMADQFKEDLQMLNDWLDKVEPELCERQQDLGDRDTITCLIEAHNAFERDLSKHAELLTTLNESIDQLPQASDGYYRKKLINLTSRWEHACELASSRKQKLKAALVKGEEFETKAHGFLDVLSNIERSLRYSISTVLPETEDNINKLLAQHELIEVELSDHSGSVDLCNTLGVEILHCAHPDAVSTVRYWLATINERWKEVKELANQRRVKLSEALLAARLRFQEIDELLGWLDEAERSLFDMDDQELPENIPIVEQLLHDQMIFESELQNRHEEVEKHVKLSRRKLRTGESRQSSASQPNSKSGSERRKQLPEVKHADEDFSNPQVATLFIRWRKVWLLSMERRKHLQDMLNMMNEMERVKSFDFDEWRQKYLQWMKHNKSRVMDFFRRQDKDHDGKISRQEFIEGILKSGFQTTRLEMQAVADKFDENGDNYIDYREFMAALRWPAKGRADRNKEDTIQEEIEKLLKDCVCPMPYIIEKVEEGKYLFGESQKLRLVRRLRSTVMVRIGGGWIALKEFLMKDDPCRGFSPESGIYNSPSTSRRSNSGSEMSSARGTPVSLDSTFMDSLRGDSYKSSHLRTPAPHVENPSTNSPVLKVRERSLHNSPWRNYPTAQLDQEVSEILMQEREKHGTESPRGSRTSSVSSTFSDTSGSLEIFGEAMSTLKRSASFGQKSKTPTSAPGYQQSTVSRQLKTTTPKQHRALSCQSADDARGLRSSKLPVVSPSPAGRVNPTSGVDVTRKLTSSVGTTVRRTRSLSGSDVFSTKGSKPDQSAGKYGAKPKTTVTAAENQIQSRSASSNRQTVTEISSSRSRDNTSKVSLSSYQKLSVIANKSGTKSPAAKSETSTITDPQNEAQRVTSGGPICGSVDAPSPVSEQSKRFDTSAGEPRTKNYDNDVTSEARSPLASPRSASATPSDQRTSSRSRIPTRTSKVSERSKSPTRIVRK